MQTQVDPVLSISGQAVMNLSDDSAFLSLATRYNASAERDIDVGYDHFLGNCGGCRNRLCDHAGIRVRYLSEIALCESLVVFLKTGATDGAPGNGSFERVQF